MNLNFTILAAEDEESDFFLLQRAFHKNNITDSIQWVKDGMEAADYLQAKGKYSDRLKYPFPDLCILDLKMPRMGGIEFLEWMRDHPEFRVIPTIVMSSSKLDSDVLKAYSLGANTYFIKPTDFDGLVKLVKGIYEYWGRGVKPNILRSNDVTR